jgi:drug/metabolite transporter (DMT)-like permease
LAISISLVAMLAVAVWLLHKYAALKLWHGLVCILFGFYLTGFHPSPPSRGVVAG